MQGTFFSFELPKRTSLTLMILLSLLMAAYAPMASISSAESAVEASKIEQLRDKIVSTINARIASFQKTLTNLGVTVPTSDSDSLHDLCSVSANNSATSASSCGTGLDAKVGFPSDVKDKVKDFLQKIVTELTELRDKAKESKIFTSLQSMAGNLNAQSGMNMLANVQAAVTQSVESLTGVFNNLKKTANNLQGRVTKLDLCSATDASASTADCANLKTTDVDTAKTATSQLNNIGTIMTTVASILTSAITLLMTLVTTFSGMLSGMGGLGNLSSMSSLTSAGDISSLTSGLSGVTGLLTAFTGLSSQLDIAGGMGGNIQGMLSSLSGLINF